MRSIRRLVLLLAALIALVVSTASPVARARELSFDERVAAQKAIEQVYWNHRIWPFENPGPKPPLSAVMSDEAIRARVEDYLKQSNALETLWQRPITAEQLQAELDRMAENTRDGATLQALYRALGNDPLAIAETLARQTLAERLIRNWYANDTRFQGDLRARAEAALAACASTDCMKSMAGDCRETTWKRRVAHADPTPDLDSAHALRLDADEWKSHLDRLATKLGGTARALPICRLSRLEETPESFVVTAVLEQGEGAITTASATWPKRSFDAWWDAERGAVSSGIEQPSGALTLPAAPLTTCTTDGWAATSTGASVPTERFYHTAVWTGTEMIVWGGHDDGY